MYNKPLEEDQHVQGTILQLHDQLRDMLQLSSLQAAVLGSFSPNLTARHNYKECVTCQKGSQD